MDRIEAQVQVQGETSRLVFNQSTREFQFENVEVESAPYSYRFKFSMQNLMAFAGPGWVMSLAYIDPGNLEADLQQGAYTNCRLLWVLWWSTVAGLLLQELSSRLGVVTGRDLATVAKAAYPRRTSLALYAMMELAIIGSDVQEVVGSAIAFRLLFGWPLWVGCIVTGLDSFTFLAIYQCGASYFEALIAGLIVVVASSFFANFASTHLALPIIIEGLIVPSMPPSSMFTAMGTLGAVIMPHNLYLHSGLVRDRIQAMRLSHVDNDTRADLNRYSLIESGFALLGSFAINLAVVGTFAHFFYSPECGDQGQACVPLGGEAGGKQGASCSNGAIAALGVEATCGPIGLDQAGDALAATIGPYGVKVWALGLLAAGQASTMSTTFAGQIVMDGFLDLRLRPWQRATVTRLAALGPSIAIALGTSNNAATRNSINEWLNILQSIQLPFALVPVLSFTAAASVVGGRFVQTAPMIVLSVALTTLVLGSNVYLVSDFIHKHPAGGWEVQAALGAAGVAYFAFVGHLVVLGYRLVWSSVVVLEEHSCGFGGGSGNIGFDVQIPKTNSDGYGPIGPLSYGSTGGGVGKGPGSMMASRKSGGNAKMEESGSGKGDGGDGICQVPHETIRRAASCDALAPSLLADLGSDSASEVHSQAAP